MTEDCLMLIEPTADLEAEYRAFLEEFVPLDQADQLHWTSGSDTEIACFATYLARIRDAKCRRKDQGVPHTTYWLVHGRHIVGTCNLRHYLTESMWDHAGHIGYCVRPSERRKGYGARMLAMVLEKAAQLGVDEALLITSHDNAASQGVIENNGGRLISESYSERAKNVLRRYLVPTRVSHAEEPGRRRGGE